MTREVFSDFLTDFSNEVNKKKYKKLTYELWRPLYLWSKSSQYKTIRIANYKDCQCFEIMPWDDYLALPNAVRIEKSKDPDFYNYLSNEYYKHLEAQTTGHYISTAEKDSLVSEIGRDLYGDSLIFDNDDTAWGADNYFWTIDGTNISICGNTLSSTTNTVNVDFDTESLTFDGESLTSCIEKIVKQLNEKEKENKNMTFGNFDFGPVDSSVHMSMYGLAIKNASNTYVSYDIANKQIVDVDILNFDGAQKFMYKMPVAIKDIAVGDVVVHARKPMFVVAVRKDGKLAVVDPYAGEEKVIMLTKSPFGFDFATKVISFLNFGTVDANNPFGNMLPFLLMGDNKNMEDILPFMFMMNSQGATNSFAFNPMLMYAVFSKDNKMKDFLPFLFMMNQPTHTCTCNCHAEDNATQD